jgi:hypothetical protein
MTDKEQKQFANLLFSHKHLWIGFEVFRYLTEHPEMDYETVHERFSEEAYEVYQSVADALLEERPIEEVLRTVLLHSQLSEVETRDRMKKEHPPS